jgi:hypothetical protein
VAPRGQTPCHRNQSDRKEHEKDEERRIIHGSSRLVEADLAAVQHALK